MSTRRLAGVACGLLLVASAAVSCSNQGTNATPKATSSSSSSASSAGATSALCADISSLKASVKTLTSSPKGQGSLPGLKSELASMRATIKKLPADASAQYSGQVDAVKAASHALKASIRTAKDAPSASTLGAVSADVLALGATVSTLANAAASTC